VRKQKATRAESKEKTREALVDAALELVAKQGLDGPSLDAICERAGFTRGAFYVHFEDRDALIAAAMERFGERFLAGLMASAPEQAAPGTGALAGVIERFVRAVEGGKYPLLGARKGGTSIAPHQLLAACARSKALRERYRGLIEIAIGGLAAAAGADARAGRVRDDLPPRALGWSLLALVVGAQVMAELGLDPMEEDLPRVVLRLLAPKTS